MNTNQFTQKTMEALQAAQRLAIEYSNQALEQEHMLVALTQQQDGLIPQLLTKMNVDPGTFETAAAEKVSQLPHVTGSGRDPDKVYISNELDQALTAAEKQAQQMKDEYINWRLCIVWRFSLRRLEKKSLKNSTATIFLNC